MRTPDKIAIEKQVKGTVDKGLATYIDITRSKLVVVLGLTPFSLLTGQDINPIPSFSWRGF